MRFRDSALLGLVAGGTALVATRAYLRSQRLISLRDRVVVVTGASSGLGFLVAQEAASQESRLVISARTGPQLDEAGNRLRQAGSREVLPVVADVSKREEAELLISRAIEHFGHIDILINNAGIMVVGPIETMTVHDFERVMATNYFGTIYTTLAVLPHMRAQRFGRIGNVVSVGGKVAVPHLLAYTASKFAVTGFNEGLRAEVVKDNIYVTGIYPGTIRTGGHVHAEMKGDHEAEYNWFGLSDTIPGLSTSAISCAQALWKAVRRGDPEIVVGLPPKLLIALHNLSPSWLAELQPAINALLPKPPSDASDAVRGEDIHGRVADFVNKRIPEGTRPATG